MSALDAARERANAATGFTPTPEEQRWIEADADRAVAVLCAELPPPTPVLVNPGIAAALCAELIEAHRRYPAEMRLCKRRGVVDLDRRAPDDPRVVGTKFLVVYSGAPQYVHQLDALADWAQVAGRYVEDGDGTGWHRGHHCDVNVSLGCSGGMAELAVIHHKRGQWVTLHRCCENCWRWLQFGTGKANRKRLARLDHH